MLPQEPTSMFDVLLLTYYQIGWEFESKGDRESHWTN